MSEIGIDISYETPTPLTKLAVANADRIISLIPLADLPSYVRDHRALEIWDVPDASGKDIDAHRNTRDIILNKIKNLEKTTRDSFQELA